jgi:SPP1 family predicted phage head-tail adaptor
MGKTRGVAAGPFRYQVQLQSPVVQQDGASGEPVITEWTNEGGPVWAAIESLSGREWLASAEFRPGVNTRIRIRWREDITAQWRAVRGLKIYSIEAVLPRYEGMSEVHLMCGEGVITEGGQP